MSAVLVPRTHSHFNLTVMTVEKVAMEVMEVTGAMAIKVFLRWAAGLIAHRFLAGVDAEAMVVEVALLGKGVTGLMEALFVLLCNRARRQSLMYCHISNQAGRAGINGRVGTPGRPGKGGLEGQTGGNCETGHRHGPNGGEEGPCALQEFEAHNGVNGPAPIVTAYTGFVELG
jgi:hypothetical protein